MEVNGIWKNGIIVLVVLVFLLTGCVEREPPKSAKPYPTVKEGGNNSGKDQVVKISEREKQLKILKTATHVSVMALPKNWDEDAEDDGIAIYPTLLDKNDETVKFENINLTVDIEIYTQEWKNFERVRGRLIYKGTGVISSWEDGNIFIGGGIRVPFEDIAAVPSDGKYGILVVKVHLPDGRVLEAEDLLGTRIQP